MIEIDAHLTEFEGLAVVNYPADGELLDPATTAPRLFQYWTDPAAELVPASGARKAAAAAVVVLTLVGAIVWSWWALLVGLMVVPPLLSPRRERIEVAPADLWRELFGDPRLGELRALVIGPWFTEVDEGPRRFVAQLVEHSRRMPALRAIFFGDIVSEECEISWITQGDLTPLLDAFEQLEVLVVRGGNGLRFEDLRHAHLRKLVVQSGGLDKNTIADIASADLPALEHLELWLGDTYYGFDATLDELRPLWQPTTYPALRTLALRNCVLADEIAEALATEPGALERLDRLDLSLGVLSDLGAQALFNNPAIAHLESLDVHHHYLSEDWVAKLASLPIDVDVSDPQGWVDPEVDEDHRYVAVAE